MRKISAILVALVLGGCLATVGGDGRRAEGEAEFRLSLPVVLPPLVVIEPGVSVVQDFDEEVFYADGWYWARQDSHWYRSHDHRSGWARVEPRHVPSRVAQAPPGHYRHYRGDGTGRHGDRPGTHDGHGGGQP